MPFIRDILSCGSISIVGLEKNTGKTECLNYILRRLPPDHKTAVTSIGIDGERVDQVTRSAKPEIVLREGVYFSTSETYYKTRELLSELVDITDERTSLGRVVTARVLQRGKVLLSGPSSGSALKRWIAGLDRFGIRLKIIDGALSRMSSASPAISEAMILSTGAAYSADPETLVRKTKFIADLVALPLAEQPLQDLFLETDAGIRGADGEGNAVDLGIASSLATSELGNDFAKGCQAVYVPGALTDRFVQRLSGVSDVSRFVLVVRDFTKVFITESTYRYFLKKGGRLRVLQRSRLLAVTVNPTAPNGFVLDSDRLCGRLQEVLRLPVYDIVKNKNVL